MARTSKHEETDKKEVKAPPVPMLFNEPMNEMDDEELEEAAREPDETDIFMDVGAKLTANGDRITYTIKKDGEFIAGSVKHPFSWDQLQKKYGGGSFQVIARSVLQKGYVKSESRHVAEPERDEPVHEEKSETKNSMAEMFMLLQEQKREERAEMQRLEEKRERERREQDEKREQDRKEREVALKASGDTTMMMMMKMMESSNAQTTALLTAMLQGSNKKEEFSIEKVMNMMDQRMEKVIALVQGKDKTKDIDAIKLMELTATARAAGRQETMDLFAMAEKKAEELADSRSENERPEKEGSTTKMLIEALIPAAQTIMAARGGIPSVAPSALPAPSVDPHKPAAPRPPMVMRPAGPPRAAAPFTPKVVASAPVVSHESAPKKEATAMSNKDMIERTVIDEIGKDLSRNMLTGKFDPEGTADKCVKILEPFGISPVALCSQYNLDAMLSIAKAKGLPDAVKPYIERFHAHIKAKTTVGSGNAAQSS